MNQNRFFSALAICFFIPSCAEESSDDGGSRDVSKSARVEPALSDTQPSPSIKVESEADRPKTLAEGDTVMSDEPDDESSELIDEGVDTRLLEAYSISTDWFRNQDSIAQKNIIGKRFYWGPVPGGLKLGVVNGEGKFITWEGAKPFDPSEPYIVIGESIGKGGPQTSIKF